MAVVPGIDVPMSSASASHRGPASSILPSWGSRARHGSVERGAPPFMGAFRTGTAATQARRDRERDRDSSAQRARSADPTSPTFVRFNSVGPEETLDWIGALESVRDRLDVLETASRRNAQAMGVAEGNFNTATADLKNYKAYVETRMLNLETVTSNFSTTVENKLGRMEPMLAELEGRSNILATRIQSIEVRLHDILDTMGHIRRDAQGPSHRPHFDVSTPAAARDRGSDNPLTRNAQELSDEGPVSEHPEPIGIFRQPYQAARQVRFGQTADAPASTSAAASNDAPNTCTDWFASCRAAAPAPTSQRSNDLEAPPGIGEQRREETGRQAARDQWQGYQQSGRPGACIPPPSWNQAGAGQRVEHGGAPDSPFGDAQAIQQSMPKDFDISYKPNPVLKIFTGTVAEYKHWAQRAIDHICRQNHRWRDVLEYTMKYPQPIVRRDLVSTNVDNVNAWVLSTKLESWLADWFDKNLYSRRVQLAGGKSETGNGFEVWRQLYRQYSGGTQIVNYGGQMRLKDWPKCTHVLQLEAHLDSWMACLEEYGSELYAAPNMLKTMLLGVLPSEIENEIMDKPELDGADYKGIFDWCKKRIEYKRQKALAEFARKSGGNLVAALIPDVSQSTASGMEATYPTPIDPFAVPENQSRSSAPTPVAAAPTPPAGYPTIEQMNELIAALKGQPARPPRNPRPKAGARPAPGKTKFIWNPDDCWHCKGKHKREECPAWQKIMKAHNGSIARAQWTSPPGYISAKAEAYAAWKEKNGKSPKVAMLANGDVLIDSDDESDAESDEGLTMCAMVRRQRQHRRATAVTIDVPSSKIAHSPKVAPTPTLNSFQALEAFDDEDTTSDVVQQLGTWAHRITSIGDKPKSQSEKKRAASVEVKGVEPKARLITSARELDTFMKQNPTVAQIPTERRKLSKIMKILSSKIELEHDEVLVLMDSGSTINVAKIKKHFPMYAGLVIPSTGSVSGETATTACGKRLVNRGKCRIKGASDNQELIIPFQDMDVELPIVSVRKCVKSGKDVSFFEGGGELKDRATGRTIRIHEIDGTYFMKMKVHDPEVAPGFGRQGP